MTGGRTCERSDRPGRGAASGPSSSARRGGILAAVLLALASVPSACGPDLVFDNPCDKASPAFDACLCLDCPANSTCVKDESAIGAACTCGETDASWCGTARDLCCATGQVCDATKVPAQCCVPDCANRECGDDGCGRSDGCGTCDAAFGFTCQDGLCVVQK